METVFLTPRRYLLNSNVGSRVAPQLPQFVPNRTVAFVPPAPNSAPVFLPVQYAPININPNLNRPAPLLQQQPVVHRTQAPQLPVRIINSPAINSAVNIVNQTPVMHIPLANSVIPAPSPQDPSLLIHCPVCNTSYPTHATKEHVQKHLYMDDFDSRSTIQDLQWKIRSRDTQASMSQSFTPNDMPIQTLPIVQPVEYDIHDEVPHENIFVINNKQIVQEVMVPLPPPPQPIIAQPPLAPQPKAPQIIPVQPISEQTSLTRPPLQQANEQHNFFSCMDGLVNREMGFGAGDVFKKNQWYARERQLNTWEQNMLRDQAS